MPCIIQHRLKNRDPENMAASCMWGMKCNLETKFLMISSAKCVQPYDMLLICCLDIVKVLCLWVFNLKRTLNKCSCINWAGGLGAAGYQMCITRRSIWDDVSWRLRMGRTVQLALRSVLGN